MNRIVVCVLFAIVQSVGAQEQNPGAFKVVKEWHFLSQRGEVRAKLIAYMHSFHPPIYPSLSFEAPNAEGAPSTREEAGFLGEILRAMPALGYDPKSLEEISISIEDSELGEDIDTMLAKQGRWRSCIGRKYCQEAESEIDKFLRAGDAFKEFDGALMSFGLFRQSVLASDVTVGPLANQRLGQIGKPARRPLSICSGEIGIAIDNRGHSRK
jgi:hypothetical protein